jgi:hypothetical protein
MPLLNGDWPKAVSQQIFDAVPFGVIYKVHKTFRHK